MSCQRSGAEAAFQCGQRNSLKTINVDGENFIRFRGKSCVFKFIRLSVDVASVYIEKIRSHAESIDSFYFRPHRAGKFEYQKSPVGLCTLNKILPEKLLGKAGLPHKTAHCFRFTCATRLFQNSVEEELGRERTGHVRSNALFGYQKASDKQVQNVSKLLAPVNDSRKSGQIQATEKCRVGNNYSSA